MRPARAGRKSLRDTLLANNAADRFYAAMSGKAPQAQAEIKPARKRAAPKPSAVPLERDVLKSVLDELRRHRGVAWIARFNSGTFQDGNRYIRANTQRGMSDLMGMLVGGRLVAIEVKRPGGKLEPHQAEFLEAINANGGLAFMATGPDDVRRNIP